MKQIQIEIYDESGLLSVKTQQKVLSAQFDNMSHMLVFTRPAHYISNDLVLIFVDAKNETIRVNIGTQNEYAIPYGLTVTKSLKLQIMFAEGGELLEYSANALNFELKASLSDSSQTIIAPSVPPYLPPKGAAPEISAEPDNALELRNGALYVGQPKIEGVPVVDITLADLGIIPVTADEVRSAWNSLLHCGVPDDETDEPDGGNL